MSKQVFSVKLFFVKKLSHYFPKHNKPEAYSSRHLQQFLERFDLEYDMQVPIYFDHKVANNFSTFEPIYLRGIIPGQENYGMLINYLPDTDVKTRIYNKHFINVDFFSV